MKQWDEAESEYGINISHVQDFLADYEKYNSKTIKWTVSKVKKKI